MSDKQADTVSDAAAELPQYPMPRSSACPFAPPQATLAMHDEQPLAKVRIWDGSTPWLVTRHADLRAVLSDPRVSASDRWPNYPYFNEKTAEGAQHRPTTIINMDGEEHARIRRMLTRPFMFKRIAAVRPAVQKSTDDLIDTLLAGPAPADLVTALALPLPSLMIGELLGVPYTDHEFFQRNSSLAISPESQEEGIQAMIALMQYLAEMIQSKTANPEENVISDLAQRVQAGELSINEAAVLGVTLLVAGHETSANMIALGTLALLEHPEQLAILRDTDDPKVVANATEELLRYLTIAHPGQRRTAAEDIEIGGQVIRQGEGIITDLPAANWDPEVFPEPERLDLHRDARQHVAFAFGPHQCVGQQLARAELQIVYGTLFRRIPTLRLATTIDQIKFKSEELAYGVRTLPVTW
ncbi:MULTISPECIES: cytochrome P450 [Streptomyces]|uniref:Cytochrome P450 n=2 Tax=Streptomyces TaxID=1883 RepID=A0ABV9J9D6_9ACTN